MEFSMASYRFFVAGCAASCRELGYPHVAALVLDDELGPEAIVRLFGTSASKTWRRD